MNILEGFHNSRWIFTEVIAGISVILSILLLLPAFTNKVRSGIAIDFLMFVAWIAAFALMVNQISPVHCGELWYLDYLTHGDTCDLWKVAVSFTLASGVAWLGSAIVVCFSQILLKTQ